MPCGVLHKENRPATSTSVAMSRRRGAPGLRQARVLVPRNSDALALVLTFSGTSMRMHTTRAMTTFWIQRAGAGAPWEAALLQNS